jgi:hypothetical protein
MDAIEKRHEITESLLEVPRSVVTTDYQRQVRGSPTHQRRVDVSRKQALIRHGNFEALHDQL